MPTEPKALSLREQIARRRTRTPWDALSERGKQDDLAFADEIVALFVARLRTRMAVLRNAAPSDYERINERVAVMKELARLIDEMEKRDG